MLLACFGIKTSAQKIQFDSKYIKVGLVTNEDFSDFSDSGIFRDLGDVKLGNKAPISENLLNQQNVGKQILDRLFLRDEKGLHMDRLYDEALSNTIISEIEVAMQDVSADEKDILKREVAHQFLKNNYILHFYTNEKGKKYWEVFHVEIDNKIIQQAYSNWRNPVAYDQIHVPVKFVAKGKVGRNQNTLVYRIAKKVPAFAVRGIVLERHPFTAEIGKKLGVKNSDRIFVYRFKEDSKGNIYSKKVCTARTTKAMDNSTKLFMISGKLPSTKKGDVAVLRDRHHSSVSLMGQASFGNDSRIGGRLMYDYLLHFSQAGMAQYFLFAVDYNKYKKEPLGIWWDENNKKAQPTLSHANFSIGYGLGINILGRIEVMPYLMGGLQVSMVTGNNHLYYWENKSEDWKEMEANGNLGIAAHAGIKASINVWYPLQLTFGADYNVSVSTPETTDPIFNRHSLNRVNVYAGLRLHF